MDTLADSQRAVTNTVTASTLGMVGWLNRRPDIASQATIVARVAVDSDIHLRQILDAAQDFFEYDPATSLVVKQFTYGDDQVHFEVDVRALRDDDVYRIIAETQPAW